MIEGLNLFRGISLLSITIRLVLCIVCGGTIGLEREFKRRPAGFRTHILVCLGAAMTTLTGEFLLVYMHYDTDIGRLGAQVVAGIGFLGAGTIITRRERVSGLTTAAGLWTSAIVGLAIGAGFYEGAFLTTVLVEVAELLFSRLEYYMFETIPDITLYVEYLDRTALDRLLTFLKERDTALNDLQITRSTSADAKNACAIVSVRLKKRSNSFALLRDLRELDGILLVQEM